MVEGFSKMYIFSFFGHIFFCKHFYYITGFCDKNSIFANLLIFFLDSKSRAQEFSNDVSFVIFGNQTWDLKGVSNWPPPHILVFKYPSRDRVNCFYSVRYVSRGCSPIDFDEMHDRYNRFVSNTARVFSNDKKLYAHCPWCISIT